MPDITVVGSANMDLVIGVERLVQLGETLPAVTWNSFLGAKARIRPALPRALAEMWIWSRRSERTRLARVLSPASTTPEWTLRGSDGWIALPVAP